MYVEYEIKDQEFDKCYFVKNLGVFEVEKPDDVILNVYFINGSKVFIVPFGDRHYGSPVDVLDMLENYTGMYTGVFEASNGTKIFTELNLNKDYSYSLKQKYLTANGKVFKSFGKWCPAIDISSFVLDKNEDLIFYFIDKNTIEKLNSAGEISESNKYILKKNMEKK